MATAPSDADLSSSTPQPGQSFLDPAVEAVFDGYESAQRKTLLALRKMVLEVAAQTPGVGLLEETLKWGQPSYLTSKTRSGSTLRIDAVKNSGQVALYVHCQTNLAETFKQLYSDELTVEGKRALLFSSEQPLPDAPLRHCIALALTYHQRKKKTS